MKVGIAGIGFMGMVHYLSYQKLPGVEVVALAEPNEKRLAGDWTDIKGNFGPTGEMMDLSGIATYTDAAKMVEEADIDYVDICLPPSMHADLALKAFECGKHVFSEKPIALSTDAAESMVSAAQLTGKQLFIGHVLPFFPEYKRVREIIKSQEYGKLLGGSFTRVISDPSWLKMFWEPNAIGGPMLDLHVHDAHFIRLLFGMPTAVITKGRMRGELAEYFNTFFEFEDPSITVMATGGTIGQQGRPFMHGFEIHLEEATLQFQFAVVGDSPELMMPFTILKKDGTTERPELGDGDPMLAFERELQSVVDSIQSGEPSPILNGNLAHDAVKLCHKQTESLRTGNRVEC